MGKTTKGGNGGEQLGFDFTDFDETPGVTSNNYDGGVPPGF